MTARLSRHQFSLVTLMGLIVWMAGCAAPTHLSPRATRALNEYRYEDAVEQFRNQLQQGEERNAALAQLRLASAALDGGNFMDAELALRRAAGIMVGVGGTMRGMASLVGDEAVKIFKGDPFEKAMAYLYLGIIFFQKDDYETARAAFRKALLMDQQTSEGYRDDQRLVHYLLAHTYKQLGEADNARLSLAKARVRLKGSPYPPHPCYEEQLFAHTNAIILVELGMRPLKVRSGPGGSLDTFRQVATPDRGVRIRVGDRPLQKASLAHSLMREASTMGRTGKDGVQASKGIVRDAAIATAVATDDKDVRFWATMVALFTQSKADVRQWEFLPAEIHLGCGNVNAGQQTVVLDFLGARGEDLATYRQVWYYIPTSSTRPRLMRFRSGQYKGNGYYLSLPVHQIDSVQ